MTARNWVTGEIIRVGDIVTRNGTDLHRVLAADDDLIEVECIRAPTNGFCKVGDVEINLVRRYSFPDELTIEGVSERKP